LVKKYKNASSELIVKKPIPFRYLHEKTQWMKEEHWWQQIYPDLMTAFLITAKTIMLIMPCLGENTLFAAIREAKTSEEQLRIFLDAAQKLQQFHA
jgi:hypothetical protein